MRWKDERYVRFYTRDTPEWLALSWQARGLFGLLMRAVDRAGLLKVGKLGPKGAAVAVHAPWTDVELPLQELLDDGCVTLKGDTLVIPNYLAAQEAPQSDVARKRKERERDLALANAANVTDRDLMPSHPVTNGHDTEAEVTDGHAESQAVTPSHAVPSRAFSPLPPQAGAEMSRQPQEPQPEPEPEQAEPEDARPGNYERPVATPKQKRLTRKEQAEVQKRAAAERRKREQAEMARRQAELAAIPRSKPPPEVQALVEKFGGGKP